MHDQQLKYPLKNARDYANRLTIGDLLSQLNKAIESGGSDKFIEVLDEEFLWGAWGHVFADVRDPLLIADIRGLVYSALTGDWKPSEEEQELEAFYAAQRHALKGVKKHLAKRRKPKPEADV